MAEAVGFEPTGLSPHLISSQRRYNRFGTPRYIGVSYGIRTHDTGLEDPYVTATLMIQDAALWAPTLLLGELPLSKALACTTYWSG